MNWRNVSYNSPNLPTRAHDSNPGSHDRSSDAPLTEPMRTTFSLYKIHNVLFFNRPQPSITWYRKDATPGSRHDSVPLATGHRLTLHAAEVTDSGVYRCVATQSGGRHNRTLQFNVFIRGVLTGATVSTVVSLIRLSVGCVTTPRRQSGHFAGF